MIDWSPWMIVSVFLPSAVGKANSNIFGAVFVGANEITKQHSMPHVDQTNQDVVSNAQINR